MNTNKDTVGFEINLETTNNYCKPTDDSNGRPTFRNALFQQECDISGRPLSLEVEIKPEIKIEADDDYHSSNDECSSQTSSQSIAEVRKLAHVEDNDDTITIQVDDVKKETNIELSPSAGETSGENEELDQEMIPPDKDSIDDERTFVIEVPASASKIVDTKQNVAYTCDVCDLECKTYKELKCHQTVEHVEKNSYPCKDCLKVFPNRKNFKRHIAVHNTGKQHKCNLCPFESRELRNLKFHKMIHSGEKPFQCDLCRLKFRHVGTMNRHKLLHNEINDFKCDECSFECKNLNMLKKHKLIKHCNDLPLQCDVCDFKCKLIIHLEAHKMSHAGQKPLCCDVCDYTCKRQYDLNSHRLTHEEKSFKCDVCAYKCVRSSTLNIHKLIHTSEKPYKCDVCSFETKHLHHLNNHKLIHTDYKPFKCDMCDYKCRQVSNLKMHKSTHFDEKPHKCDLCNFDSRHFKSLKRHKIIMHKVL